MTAQHFEVKKHAVRQTADGWVMSFVVHPVDMTPEFAVAPLGTRYMLALAEIGDDEQPVPPQPPAKPSSFLSGAPAPATPAKDAVRSMASRDRYAMLGQGEQAVVRSALLAKDSLFQQWLVVSGRALQGTEEMAARYIREACGVSSRRDIALYEAALDEFKALETSYKAYRDGYELL